jgi:hypothetical protein
LPPIFMDIPLGAKLKNRLQAIVDGAGGWSSI